MTKPTFESLAPHRPEAWVVEPVDAWWKRVGDRIPNIPLAVAEQWIHRHVTAEGGGFPFNYLPIERLAFDRAMWPVERFDAVQYATGLGPVLDPGRLDDPMIAMTWLAKNMTANGTWPVPIVVLDNLNGFPDRYAKPLPRWCVIEGHERFAYLNCLRAKGIAQPMHDVFVMRINDAPTHR